LNANFIEVNFPAVSSKTDEVNFPAVSSREMLKSHHVNLKSQIQIQGTMEEMY
jgi:hypothetical protein